MFSRDVDGLNARKVQESSCSGALQGLTVQNSGQQELRKCSTALGCASCCTMGTGQEEQNPRQP